MGWARLGRTLRTVGSPRSLLLKIWVTGTGEWNYDRFGARPDGIMPQGIKLLAFGVSLLGIPLMRRHFTMESLILAQDER